MKFFLALLPPSLILGLLDYRFHNYLWPSLNAIRPKTGFMFDFFSFFDFYLIVFVLWYGITALLKKNYRSDQTWRWIYIPIVLIILGAIISRATFIPVDPQIKSFTFEIAKNYIGPILLFLILIFSLRDGKNSDAFTKSLLICFSFLGAFSIFEYFTGVLPGENKDFLGRLVWPYVDPFFKPKAESANWLAYIYGTMTILSFVQLTRKKTLLGIFAFLVSGLVLALTKSYTGIGLVSLIIFFLLFLNARGKRKAAIVILFILFIMFGIATQIKSRKFQILLGNYKKENSLERRMQIYRFNFQALREHLWAGLGPGNYQSYFRKNMERVLGKSLPEEEIPPHPHNLVFHFWSDLGIFGFLGVIIIYIVTLAKIIKKPLFYASSFPLLYLLAHGLVDVPYGLSEISYLFWMMMALDFSRADGG